MKGHLVLLFGLGLAGVGQGQQLPSLLAGYLQLAPDAYRFSGYQGVLQRYQLLDPRNEWASDRLLATLDGLGLAAWSAAAGGPRLELYHHNFFLGNDRWALALAGPGWRGQLHWHDFLRPLEKFVPQAATDTFSYASRFNDDLRPSDDLRLRRQDLQVDLTFRPEEARLAWPGVRAVEVSAQMARRLGQRQFTWIFGIVEDLVIPVGNNPSRWRGRGEEVDQQKQDLAATGIFALGPANLTFLTLAGERFSNRAPTVTNADVARYDPAINTNPNTINYLADYQGYRGELTLQQQLARAWRVELSGGWNSQEQRSYTPYQQRSVHHGQTEQQHWGGQLVWEPTAAWSASIFGQWRRWRNETTLGTAAQEPRAFLLLDRNLSGPFWKKRETSQWGAMLRFASRALSLRAGFRQEASLRTLIYGVGSNAIPAERVGWNPRSDPRTLWVGVQSRGVRSLTWGARAEARQADETWSPADPKRLVRVRGNLAWQSQTGLFGFSLSGQFDHGTARPQPLGRQVVQDGNFQYWSATATFWHTLGAVQLFGVAQAWEREQDANLLLSNVRRWRPYWRAEVVDPHLQWEGHAQTLSAGVALTPWEKVTFTPSLTWVRAQGGTRSAAAAFWAFTRQDQVSLVGTLLGEWALTKGGRAFLQYSYQQVNDEVEATRDGHLHAVSVGLTYRF
ncbi:MAG: hypothetical protein NZ869_08455 [Thermoanaerobaculum sp.]|nr:hypothetical protein [Thermoanaerobaculum sp.]